MRICQGCAMDKHELSKIDFEFIRMSAFGGKADIVRTCGHVR